MGLTGVRRVRLPPVKISHRPDRWSMMQHKNLQLALRFGQVRRFGWRIFRCLGYCHMITHPEIWLGQLKQDNEQNAQQSRYGLAVSHKVAQN